MDIKVLIAEDDSAMRNLLCDIIKKQGYEAIPAKDGSEAIDAFFGSDDISLCILDVMMPVYDGWEVLEEIRSRSEVPILMLTALGEQRNEVKGLSHGADDYIAKPFSYPVLIARIESLLRKIKREQEGYIELGELVIDKHKHRIVANGNDVVLDNKEFKLLNFLITNQDIVLDRDKLIENVWVYDFEGDIRTVDTHIKTLRAKLGECGKYIKTIRGTGYIFEVEK